MKIEKIFEDENILVINKPAGVVVHRGVGVSEKQETITDWLLARYPEIAGVGEDDLRPGIVHRLDKETSGVLIIAKKQATFLQLKNEFIESRAKKIYRAIVEGNVKDDRGVIDRPIGRAWKNIFIRITGRSARGKLREAITYYKVITRQAGYSYLELYPETGRTHQIRVHLKSIGHPIVCDKDYGAKGVCPASISRVALHALSLEISVPEKGKMSFSAPLPADFSSALEEIGFV